MKDNALEVSSGLPPGAPPGTLPDEVRGWRATAAVLRSTGLTARYAPAFQFRSPVHAFGSAVTYAFTSVVDDLVTTIFPADCRACGGPLLRAASSPRNVPICNLCLDQLRDQSQTYPSALCRICGEALDMESDRFLAHAPNEGILCTPCRRVPPPFEQAVAYGVYRTELREMLHLLKYEGVRSLAGPLGAKLAQAVIMLGRNAAWTGTATVIAVPLFASTRRRRGFNQAEALADAAIANLRKLRPAWQLAPRHEALQRVKDTASQFQLSDKGRRRNMVGAFKVKDDKNHLAGRDVLLIDDIYTTGATSRACAAVLGRAGVRHVWVATLARAQKEQVALWEPNARDFG